MFGAFLQLAVLYALAGWAGAQFGEIASIVTGLLGSGGGLAGLAGTGASAGAGAASGALSGIGPLYQLAQAALQLTGTGVGIANQASESAWFPVAVENAARMNRDFQERLLKGPQPGLGGVLTGGPSTREKPTEKISGEYGKNFESGETTDGDGDGGESPPPPLPPSARGGAGGNDLLPSPSRLPGLVSLLPGETGAVRSNSAAPRGNANGNSRAFGSEESGSLPIQPVPSPSAEAEKPTPRINIQLPPGDTVEEPANTASGIRNTGDEIRINYDYEDKDKEKKPSIDFNSDETAVATAVDDGELLDRHQQTNKTIPPLEFKDKLLSEVATAKDEKSTSEETEAAMRAAKAMAEMFTEEFERQDQIPHMVPELQKLISTLRKSNLSRQEFIEIAKQLEMNTDPRENTTPVPDPNSNHTDSANGENGGRRKLRLPNPKRERASQRNLEALRSTFADETDSVLHNIEVTDGTDREPPVVLMLPNRHRDGIHERPKVHAVTPHHRHIIKGDASAQSQTEKQPPRVIYTGDETPATDSITGTSNMFTTTPAATTAATATIYQTLSPSSPQTQPHVSTIQPFTAPPTTLSFLQQQQEAFNRHQQQVYNDLYRNYINLYYPQYAAQYYSSQNVYSNKPAQYSAPTYNPNQYQQQPAQQQQQWNQNQYWTQQQSQQQQQQYYRQLPSRVVSQSVVTTPPSALQHPFSHGSLITLMQPQQPVAQPQTVNWAYGR